MPDYKFKPGDHWESFNGSKWVFAGRILGYTDMQMAKKVVDENPGRYRIVRGHPMTSLVIVYQ